MTRLASESAMKLERLRGTIREFGSCLVAYSGGVDSALVLAVAHEQLGDRAVGCIGVSPSFPQRERRHAMQLAETIGARYRLADPREDRHEGYLANAADRCYFCKHALFDCLRRIAADEGFAVVADGVHAGDVGDHTHGMRAAVDQGVRSPLLEAAFTKEDVRTAASAIGLPDWACDKPATACLASRVPHGTPITPELLRQIERAEDVLAAIGLRQFRVRHHGEIARVEVPPEEFETVVRQRERIVREIRSAGYRFVALDLAGFRSTSTSPPIEIHISHERLA